MNGLDGVLAVAGHEVRMRLRAGRWRWLLGLWVGVNLLFVVLLKLAIGSADAEDAGAAYGVYLFFVLALALLVVPALASTAVNGDRERGTLALLQVTRLRPWEIAVGKLAAAAGTALVFWALTLPLVGWRCSARGWTPGCCCARRWSSSSCSSWSARWRWACPPCWRGR